tara:strand:- start:579 stop:1451 length:873 start_codon:yes stop_codon:yes gene_type:complete
LSSLTEKTNTSSQFRELCDQSYGIPASDGDGVKLTRVLGSPELNMLDPFLLLDVFESNNPSDYIGGFPDHPHRGFETVTYLLAGCMRHKDSVGHEGVIKPGGVQWMTAGRGIIHSEMPEQKNGFLKGFQLWVNLPASHKMINPMYQEFIASAIPLESIEATSTVKVISGTTNKGTIGPVKNYHTDPIFLDVFLEKDATLMQSIPNTHNGFLYIIDGAVQIGKQGINLSAGLLGVLGNGDMLSATATDSSARFLLIGGKRLNEPVARGGPFVMNTKKEILQAFEDYQQGKL